MKNLRGDMGVPFSGHTHTGGVFFGKMPHGVGIGDYPIGGICFGHIITGG